MSRCIECGKEMSDVEARLYYECAQCRAGKRRKSVRVPTAYQQALCVRGETRPPKIVAEMGLWQDVEASKPPRSSKGAMPCPRCNGTGSHHGVCPDCGGRGKVQW